MDSLPRENNPVQAVHSVVQLSMISQPQRSHLEGIVVRV